VKLFGGLDDRVRPLAQTATLLASLLVIVSGLVAHGWHWGALGIAIGVPGVVLPYVARWQGWSVARVWLLMVLILVLDFGVMSSIAGTPGT
jgi:hypothetical protein